MSYPNFFHPRISTSDKYVDLDEANARHAIQVLRLGSGDQINILNGKGLLATCSIVETGKKKCRVEINKVNQSERRDPQMHIGFSLVKNNTRFEWFLEKATELGIRRITPLVCKRTEKSNFKAERFQSILVSAMLQSKQLWLPELVEPQKISTLIQDAAEPQKFIAHCLETEKKAFTTALDKNRNTLILIGPEGDFTEEEIALCLQNKFQPVSLGNSRLRAETAAIAAAVIMMI